MSLNKLFKTQNYTNKKATSVAFFVVTHSEPLYGGLDETPTETDTLFNYYRISYKLTYYFTVKLKIR